MTVRDIETNKHKIVCDNCRQDEMKRLAIHSYVKSHVHYIVKCYKCGYEAIKKLSAKRNL